MRFEAVTAISTAEPTRRDFFSITMTTAGEIGIGEASPNQA
jgi:hypothetical protein